MKIVDCRSIYFYQVPMNINLGFALDDFQDRLHFSLNKSHQTNDDEITPQEQTVIYQPLWEEPTQLPDLAVLCRVCPLCGRTVAETELQLYCKSSRNYFYAAHYPCAENSTQFIEYTRTARKQTSSRHPKKPSNEIGCREYLVQISIEHPLTRKNFYSGCRKLKQLDGTLLFNLTQPNQSDFEPNTVVFPLKQLKCTLIVKPLYFAIQRCETLLRFRIDLSQEAEGLCTVRVEDQSVGVEGEFQVVESRGMKMEIVGGMNFKYRKQYLEETFVRLRKIWIDLKSAITENNPQSNPSIKQQSSKSQKQQNSSHRANSQSPPKPPNKSPSKLHFQPQQPQPQPMPQPMPSLFPFPYTDHEFIAYIKTQTGSKQFQKKAKSYKGPEIDRIISQILPHIEEVIQHGYANYMFQSLLAVCDRGQRMRIVGSVGGRLAGLVCGQQGTFVFQQLVMLLVQGEEFQAVCRFIVRDFKAIALDNYGHHFLRRLFEKMPKQLLTLFLPAIHQDFIQLSTSRNAVFIIQCTLKGLHTIQTRNPNPQYSYDIKKFLEALTLHTDQLIIHEYGNYLIQEAYESIELDRLKGVSEYIIKFFMDYSCEKFSSNVVINCVRKYWRNDYAMYAGLKDRLDRKRIRTMYRNKQGNKVLLEIMELTMQLGLKDKISEIIRNEQPSKFNNQRWVSITGKCKTGAVGTNYTSFSQAHSFTKRKHY